jgi:hypothetical protein
MRRRADRSHHARAVLLLSHVRSQDGRNRAQRSISTERARRLYAVGHHCTLPTRIGKTEPGCKQWLLSQGLFFTVSHDNDRVLLPRPYPVSKLCQVKDLGFFPIR